MTDPSTLFLSTPQVRPSWTLNGLTLELNLAPSHGTPPNTADNSNYATQTFQAIQHPNNAATSTVFASVMGQGQCATPVRFAMRGGNSCWTQANAADAVSNELQTAVGDSVFAVTQSASFLSTSTLNGGVPAVSTAAASSSTVTNTLIPSNPVVEQSVSQMNNCAGFYVSSVTAAGAIEDASKKPLFLAAPAGQQQVPSENVEKKKRQKAPTEGPSTELDDASTSSGEQKSADQTTQKKTPCQVAEITTSAVSEVRDNCALADTTQTTTTVSAASITTSSVVASLPASKIATPTVPITATGSPNGIPVGIAVARQRYVSSTSCKSQTQNLKETISASSTSSPYAPSVPYQPIIEPSSIFPPALSNIGVVAGTTGCDDRSIANIGGNILPSIIAWPQQQQQQQQHAVQQWYPYTGAMETVTQNISPACTGYQLVRDPVNGHIILIPANQIGSTQSTATAGFATTTNQQLQSFLIPQHFQHQQQQQSQSHSLFLDHLVSVVPSSTNIKQNSVSSTSTLLKLHDGVLTGVMMPCDLSKASVVNPTQSTATIGQQLLSANNSSISLVHQFNSSNIHNPSMNAPHHFSSISSSGSVLIQQISGNTSQSPLINHINNSVMIAESTAMQSVINTQPTYPAGTTPFLLNTPPVSATENATTAVSQVQPTTACIVSGNSQQAATYGQLASSINELAKPAGAVQSKIVNIEKQVSIETKSTNANDQTWSTQSTAQILVEKNEEKAVIKIDTNSIVQDASNQTEDSDDKDEEDECGVNEVNERNDVGDEQESSKSECDDLAVDRGDSSRKLKLKRNKTIANEIKVYNDSNPAFIGLQLLLNGIERVEHSGNATAIADEEERTKEETDDSDKDIDKPAPNGLEILCALADQRFKEEKKKSVSDELSSDDSRYDKKTCLKGSKISLPYKLQDVDESDKNVKSERVDECFTESACSRLRLPSITPNETDPLQMRIEFAKLKKKYQETRKELCRLNRKRQKPSSLTRSPTPDSTYSPTCDNTTDLNAKLSVPIKRKPGRPRKYSDPLDAKRRKIADVSLPPAKPTIKPMKRPKLKLDTDVYANISEDDVKVSHSNNGDLSPPVLEPMCTPPKSKSFKNEVLSPPTLVANKVLCVGPKGLPGDNERPWSPKFERKPLFNRLSSDDLLDEDIFKPKEKAEPIPPVVKRKVGRPRKYPKEDVGSAVDSKNNKVAIHKKNTPTLHKSSEKQIPVTSSVVSTFAFLKSQRTSVDAISSEGTEYKPKITPKLKAEAKLKTWRQKSPEICRDLDLDFPPKKKKKIESMSSLLRTPADRKSLPFLKRDKSYIKDSSLSSTNSSVVDSSKLSLSRSSASNSTKSPASTSQSDRSTKSPSPALVERTDKELVITPELLDSCTEHQSLRVLVPAGNLFRTGTLSAVEPPDIYGIKLDGERGQKRHFYTREQVLKDVVLEVRGEYPLRIGTRVCAFWSSQYQSLYPGNVMPVSSLDESEDENFTAVEFDDGDKGRIKMDDIRLLPKDISICRKDDSDSSEGAGKRKRRISSVSFDEIPVDKQLHSPERAHRHKNDSHDNVSSNSATELVLPQLESKNNDIQIGPPSDSAIKKKNSERKKLKKKHKDKLRENSDSSCKRKSHKHRSDTDDGSAKGHKRHKHKHKHHKHHKRKRSHDTERGESDNHYKCSSKSHVKANKVDKLLDDDSDWTSVPPYSSHLTEAKKTEFSSLKVNSPKANDKNESATSKPAISVKKSLTPSKTELKRSDDEKLDSKKVEDETNAEREKVEIKRIRYKKSVSEDNEKDDSSDTELPKETNSVDKAEVKESSETKINEQRDSSPSEETDASTSSRRDSEDSTSDSENSSEEKLWDWHGKGFRRGRARREFYKSIKRGDVVINVGDCAVFLTAGSSTKPFIGRIESMWGSNKKWVRVNWFYHPEETTGLKKELQKLPFLGALFESPHTDANEVRTISHKCDVVSINEYRERLKKEPERIHNVYESNDLYYLAGYYDPTAKRLQFEDGILS